MNDPIPQADAAKVLGDLGEVPRVTKTIDAKPAAAAAPGSLVDEHGVAFSAELHARDRSGNPMRRVDGGWQLKRGNGARKNSGKPASGAVSYLAPPRPKGGDPMSATQSAQSGATPPPPQAGDVDQVHDVEVETMPTLEEADYENTARGIQRGAFALARLRFGDAWREDEAERKEWTDCLRRLWHHYQLPRLGVLVEFTMLMCVTIAKRRDDAATREGWQKMKAWLGIGAPASDEEPPKAEETKAA